MYIQLTDNLLFPNRDATPLHFQHGCRVKEKRKSISCYTKQIIHNGRRHLQFATPDGVIAIIIIDITIIIYSIAPIANGMSLKS